jgi:hypothetical protein
MISKFPGKCAWCAGDYAAGAAIHYIKTAPRGKRGYHPACWTAAQASKQATSTTKAAPVSNAPAAEDTTLHAGRYDSIGDYISAPVPKHQHKHMIAAFERYEGESDWMYGSARNLDGMMARINDGWPEAVERINSMNNGDGLTAPESLRRRRVWSDQGDTLDIHRVYAGRIDGAWQRTARRSLRAPRTVRIIASIAGSCAQSEENFFWRGAAVARLSDMLTQAGYSVEIQAACVAQHIASGSAGYVDYAQAITIKHASAPLDVGGMAAVLCQPGFVRWCMFHHLYTYPGAAQVFNTWGWYGDPEALDKLATDLFNEPSPVTTVFMRYSVNSQRAAEAWVKESIATITNEEAEPLAA